MIDSLAALFSAHRRLDPAPDVMLVIASLHHGGAARQTLHTAQALRNLGCKVQVLCLFESEPGVRAWFGSLGVAVERLYLPNRWNCLRNLWEISRRIRRLRPECVHVQSFAPGLLSVLAARLAGTPRIFITMHSVGAACAWFEHLLFRIATRLAGMTLCVSQAVERSWFEPGPLSRFLPRPGEHAVVYNCLELPASPLVRTPQRSGNITWTIGYVGRVRREKGLDILLRAAAILAEAGREFKVVVAGDGPELDECRDLASSLGIADRIAWRPFVPMERMPEFYRSIDALAVPSRLEGFGLAAVEAMSFGVPVVAARTGGLAEIIDHGKTGLLFAPGDAEDLAKRLGSLMDDQEMAERFSVAGFWTVQRQFSMRVHQVRLREVYEDKEPGNLRRRVGFSPRGA